MHIIKKFIKTDYFIFILFFFSFSYYFDTLNNFVNDANKYIPYWLTINDEFRFGDIPVKFESDLFLDYAIGLIVALSIYFSISLINISKEKKTLLKKIWFTQILVIYIFSFILYYYKGLDAYGYFFLSHNYTNYTFDFGNLSHKFIFGNGTNNIIYLSRIINEIFFTSYYLLTNFLALFGLLGIFLLAINIKSFGINYNKLFIILIFLPSIFIYTSIIGKDAITFFGINLFITGINNRLKLNFKYRILFCLLSLTLIFFIRAWVSYILILSLLSMIIYHLVFLTKSIFFKYVFFLSIILFCLILYNYNFVEIIINNAGKGYSNIQIKNFINFFVNFQNNFIIPERMGKNGLFVLFFRDISDFLYFYSKGLFATLFRPMLFLDNNSFFMIIAGVQNFILFIVFLYSICFRTRNLITSFKDPLYIFCLTYIIIFSILYCVIIYMNFGTGLRYQIQILPITIILIAILLDKNYAR